MKSTKVLVVLALAFILGVFATTAFAAPLPNGSVLLLDQGAGSATNIPCSVGSCFSMEVAPGFIIWTDFGPGTDGGIVAGKSQLSGGQETDPTSTAPGELSGVWSFFSGNGTFYTDPGGNTQNIYDDAPCTGAGCIGKTSLAVFNVAWNGNIIPMGSAGGCTLSNCSPDQLAGIFVNDYQIEPLTGGAWSMNYGQVVPTGSFMNVRVSFIMRGTVIMANDEVCDDHNTCTTDTRDPATGACIYTNNTLPCDDHNACTMGDACSNGTCLPGTPINCNDGNACTTDTCNPATGCVHISITCNDNNTCTTDTCDTATGNCVFTPNNNTCTDNNACTLGDVCSNGTCLPGTPINCDDGNACTTDTCDPVTGCAYALKNCNDNDPCTADTCDTATGMCIHTAVSCPTPLISGTLLGLDQGVGSATNIPCSTGSCFGMEVAPGYVIWTDFGPGTDGGIVVGKAQLSGGQETNPASTTPGELSALWIFFSGNGTFYTDPGGNTQNIYDSVSCTGAGCFGKTTLAVFNVAWNGNIIPMGSAAGCTLSSCSPDQMAGIFVNDWQIDTVGKTWSMNYAQVVPSGSFANVRVSFIMRGTVTLADPCADAATRCNDNNLCTTDTCDPATGACIYTNNTLPCDDGNACTMGDACSNGMCLPGTPISCNDGNVCTIDSCDTAIGCVHAPIVCNDNNLCTTDSCNPETGCVYTSLNCDDNDPCTSDSCDPATGCGHTALDRSKLIITAAGNGTQGYSGDNGLATSAKLNFPFGVAADLIGDIFIADTHNHRIRKVDPSGTITTVAGNGLGGAYAGDNGPATLARLSYPMGIAVDLSGNIFIADQDNRRIRKVDTSGTITTVAGNGYVGYSGDNGPATSAKLNYPYAVTVDSIGNLFIADTYNHRIRKVDTSGIITTVAGNGTAGYSGDNGPATAAGLNNPTGVAVDSTGNIYIADIRNNRIRKVDASGIITTVAGNGISGYSGDNGQATLAELNNPFAITVDSTGTIYIADRDNARIRMVDTSGIITTVAGNGTSGYSGDNGPATTASLNNPTGVAVDSSGIIFIADEYNNRIRRVTWFTCSCTGQPDGTPCFDNNACTSNDICSNGICRATTIGCDDGNICTEDSCISPSIGCVHTNNSAPCNDNNACTMNDTCSNGSCKGTPVVCDDNNPCTSDSCDPATGCVHTLLEHIEPITTVAGNGIYGYSGDNGLATSARLYFPYDMAEDSLGNIYIADTENHRIRKVDTSGIITTVAGNGTQGYSGDNGLAVSAMLNWPTGVSLDPSGNIYIVDHFNNRIRKIDTSGIITTVAGTGTAEDLGDNGPATSASLSFPSGMAVDSSGNLYIADSYNYRIRKVDTSGIITTVAGNGTGGYSGDNGPATSASLSVISGVAVDSLGNIYISDTFNNRIRKVDTSGTITTVAGNGTGGYSGDNGPATSASLLYPSGVAVDSLGSIYISDTYNNRIRKVDSFGIITTVAGTGIGWYSGDNGPAVFAQLNTPEGVAVDSSGNIFIADSSNQRIRKITLLNCSCAGQLDGTLCNDNNACTTGDACSNGACVGTPVVCQSGYQCVGGTCVPITDCTGYPAGTACEDGNVCTINDVCKKQGKVMVCKGTALSNGTSCEDGDMCTVGDTCLNGTCHGSPKNCNDGNNCTTDSCDPTTGACVHELGLQSVIILGSVESGENSAANKQIQTQFTIDQAASPGACITSYDIRTVHVSDGATVNFDYRYGTGPDPTSGTLDGVALTQDTGKVLCPVGSNTVHTLYLTNTAAPGGKDVDNIKIQGF